MPLILVPLTVSGDTSRGLQDAIGQFLTMACLGGDGNSPLREPVWVAPAHPDEWTEGNALSAFVQRGVILCDADSGDSLDARLERALAGATRHLGRAPHRLGGEALRPITVVMPIGVVTPDNPDPSLLFSQLSTVAAQIERAAATSGSAHSCRILPWISTIEGGAVKGVREVMTSSKVRMTVLLHEEQTRGAGPQGWAAMGIGRLLAELLAIHALCAQEATFEEWLPATNPAHDPTIYRLHSSFLECPLAVIVRQRALEALRGAGAAPALLPDPTALAALTAESTNDTLTSEVEARISDLVKLISDDTISADVIRLPAFDVAPASGDWDRLSALPEVAPVAPICRVPDAHRDFVEDLERQAGVSFVQKQVREGLDGAIAKLDAVRADLELVFRNTMAGVVTSGSSRGALGRTLAQIDYAIKRCTEVRAPQVEAGQNYFDGQVSAARDLRGRWCDGESRLLATTARMPTVLSIVLEAVAASVGVAVAVPLLARAFLPEAPVGAALAASLTFGAAAGFGLVQWRLLGWRRLRQEWTRFERELVADAHAIRERVASGINERVSHLKGAAASDLRQTLSGIRARLDLELVGFLTLIDDELAALVDASRRRADRESSNWLVVDPPSGLLPDGFEGKFHLAWASLLNQVVAVVRTPEPITLSQYERLIQEQVSDAVASVDARALTDGVQLQFERVRKMGTDVRFLPVGTPGDSRRALGMAGEFVSTQVDRGVGGWDTAAELDQIQWPEAGGMTWLRTPGSPVAALLPSGVAVVITREEVQA